MRKTSILPFLSLLNREKTDPDFNTIEFATKYARQLSRIKDFLDIYQTSRVEKLESDSFEDFSQNLIEATTALTECYKNFYLAKRVFLKKNQKNIFFQIFNQLTSFNGRARKIAQERSTPQIQEELQQSRKTLVDLVKFQRAKAHFQEGKKLVSKKSKLDKPALDKARKHFSVTISAFEDMVETAPDRSKPLIYRFLATAYYFKTTTSDTHQIFNPVQAAHNFKQAQAWYQKNNQKMPRKGYLLGKLIYQELTDILLNHRHSKLFGDYIRGNVFDKPRSKSSIKQENLNLAVDCCLEAIKVNQAALKIGYRHENDYTNLGHLYLEMAKLKPADSKKYLGRSILLLKQVVKKNPQYALAKFFLAQAATLADQIGMETNLEQRTHELWDDLASQATKVRDHLSRSLVCTIPEDTGYIEENANWKIPKDSKDLESVVFEETTIRLMHEENQIFMRERGLTENFANIPRIEYATPKYLVLEHIGEETFYQWLTGIFEEDQIKTDTTLTKILTGDFAEKDIKEFKQKHKLVFNLYKQAQEEAIRQRILLERIYHSGKLERALAEKGIDLKKKIKHFNLPEDYVERFEKSLNKINFKFGYCTHQLGTSLGQDDYGQYHFIPPGHRYTKKHLYLAFRNFVAPKLAAIKEKSIDFDCNPTNFLLGLNPEKSVSVCGGIDFETLRYRAVYFMNVLFYHQGPHRTFFRGHHRQLLKHDALYTMQQRDPWRQVMENDVTEEELDKMQHDDFFVYLTRLFTMIGTNQNKLLQEDCRCIGTKDQDLLIRQQKEVYLPNIKSRLNSPLTFLSPEEKNQIEIFYDIIKDLQIIH